MRKSIVSVVFSLLVVACALVTKTHTPVGTVLYAQSLPTTVHAQWNPNAVTDNVTGYLVTVDGVAQPIVAPTTDATCGCVQTVLTFDAFGPHTVKVAAENLSISTDPTSTQTGAASTINFTLAQAAVVANPKVVK